MTQRITGLSPAAGDGLYTHLFVWGTYRRSRNNLQVNMVQHTPICHIKSLVQRKGARATPLFLNESTKGIFHLHLTYSASIYLPVLLLCAIWKNGAMTKKQNKVFCSNFFFKVTFKTRKIILHWSLNHEHFRKQQSLLKIPETLKHLIQARGIAYQPPPCLKSKLFKCQMQLLIPPWCQQATSTVVSCRGCGYFCLF